MLLNEAKGDQIARRAADRTPVPALHDLPLDRVLFSTLGWQAFALVCLACHMALVREIGPLCFPLILGCVFAAARHSTLAGLVVYAQILFYQNITISLFSTVMTHAEYTLLSGTSFAAALLLAARPVCRWLSTGRAFASANPALARTAAAVTIALGVAVAYSILGVAVAGPTSAMVGFRNATALLLAILIGLDVGDRWSYRTAATCLVISILPGVLLAAAEIADPAWYLSFVNATDFNNVKYATAEMAPYFGVHDVISHAMQLPFNTEMLSGTLPGPAYRFGGPNMHPISYGYVLAITELMLLSLGWWLLVPPLVILSFLAGVKGAAVLVFATGLLYGLWSATRSIGILFATGLVLSAAYVAFGIVSGLSHGDFHVIGFLGGVNGFLKNPAGHGIGVGGNLSVGRLSMAQWQTIQHAGAADVGLESAVGVLIYQMGIGCLALVTAAILLLRGAPFGAAGRARPTDLLFIGVCVGLVNGVFQEEAYSPYATGLLCLLCGVLVANGRRIAMIMAR